MRLVRRRPGIRQLYLLRRGHLGGHRRQGDVAPPWRARGDIYHRAEDTLVARAAEEEVPDVVGAGDGFRPPKTQVIYLHMLEGKRHPRPRGVGATVKQLVSKQKKKIL